MAKQDPISIGTSSSASSSNDLTYEKLMHQVMQSGLVLPAPKQLTKTPLHSVPIDLENMPSNPWVFKTLSMGGWDYEGNPILVVATLELIKHEQTGKMQGSNVIFDFVDPKKPSQRVAVMTESLIEVLEQIKGVYTMEQLAGEDKEMTLGRKR